jgi:hypothetical protein
MIAIGNMKSDANAFSASMSTNNNVSAPAISFNCKDAFGGCIILHDLYMPVLGHKIYRA